MSERKPESDTAAKPASSVEQHVQNGKVVENPWRRLREFTDARIGVWVNPQL